jgi:N-acetylneuraminic acid mutarotase
MTMSNRLTETMRAFVLRRLVSILIAAPLAVAASAAHAQTPGAWKMVAPMPRPMGEIVAATAAGKIYVLAGLDDVEHTPYGTVWEYDPAADKWTVKKQMPGPAHHVMVASYHDKIYMFGGYTRPTEFKAWQPTNKAWEYDPANDTWKALAPMPMPRGAGQAVEVGGKIYVIGGVESNEPGNPGAPIRLGSTAEIVVGTMEAYDPATNKWEQRASMPTARNHYEAAAVNGKIYAIDGRIGTTFITKSDVIDLVEVYDPAKDQWTYCTRSPTSRGDVTGAVYDSKIYVAGGEFQDTKRKMTFWAVESYDPAKDSWAELPHLQIARHGFAAAFVGNTLHVMGGSFQSDGMPGIDTPTATHEVFQVQ